MIFNGPDRIIVLESGVTSYTAREIYSSWKAWVHSGAGAPYVEAFTPSSGNIDVGGGVSTGAFFILTNAWKLRPAEESASINITGNLYSQDGIVFLPTVGGFTVEAKITRATDSTILQGSSAPLSNQDIERIAEAVWNREICPV